MQIKKIVGALVATAVAGTMVATAAAESFNGYIYFQTAAYSFRDPYSNPTYGHDSDYYNDFITWGGDSPETYPEYEDKFDYDISGYVLDATYVDANVTGAGTYKVSAEVDFEIDKSVAFNSFGVSTDLPWKAADTDGVAPFEVTDVKVWFDGVEVASGDIDVISDLNGYATIEICNIYGAEEVKTWAPSVADAYPKTKLEIEFTVAEAAAPEEPEAPTDPEPEAPADPEPEAPANPGDSSKPNAGTGAEGLALVAGVAVLAAGAVVVAKKRK